MIYTTITMDGSRCNDEKRIIWQGLLTLTQSIRFLEFISDWALGISFSSMGIDPGEKPKTKDTEILKECVKYMLVNSDKEEWTEKGYKELKQIYKWLFKEEWKELPF